MRRKKSKLWIIITLAVLLIGVLGGSYYFISTLKKDKEAAEQLAEAREEFIESNMRYVYVAMEDIKRGDIITDGKNVQLEECLTALPDYVYIDESYIGNTAVVDIEANTPVFVNMIAKETITNDLREVEIGVARLNINTSLNDYVDIRIRFANAADYIVCAKKRIKAYDLKNSIFYTDLTESEILCLASATIDAYINSGTKIYLTKYEEPNLQEDAIPFYPVNETVHNLMATDPNIIEVAEHTLNLEARHELAQILGTLDKDYLDAVTDGEDLEDTAHSQSLTAQYSYLDSNGAYPSTFVNDADSEAENKKDSTVIENFNYSLDDGLGLEAPNE